MVLKQAEQVTGFVRGRQRLVWVNEGPVQCSAAVEGQCGSTILGAGLQYSMVHMVQYGVFGGPTGPHLCCGDWGSISVSVPHTRRM